MTRNQARQDDGNDPLALRDTNHYQDEYVHSFVEKWDQLIDWDRRAESEGDFFIGALKEHGARKVLDVATGTGFHSVQLIEAGFEVTSADGNPVMLAKAFENARRRDHILRTVQADWRWLNRDVHDYYDAVICLGNSFSHLHDENDRRKALAEFYATLRHDGILILDQRNYDAILDHEIDPNHDYYYYGDDVRATPEHVDESLARFRYEFPGEEVFHLNMFPLRKNYVRRLLQEVGFQRTATYGDFKETHRETEPDFFIHVAEKQYIRAGEEERVSTEDNDEAAKAEKSFIATVYVSTGSRESALQLMASAQGLVNALGYKTDNASALEKKSWLGRFRAWLIDQLTTTEVSDRAKIVEDMLYGVKSADADKKIAQEVGNFRRVALALVNSGGYVLCRRDSGNGDNLVCAAAALRSQRGLDKTPAEPHSAHKWLDGVSDALTDSLRRLRDTSPAPLRQSVRALPLPTDYRPSPSSPWPAAVASAFERSGISCS